MIGWLGRAAEWSGVGRCLCGAGRAALLVAISGGIVCLGNLSGRLLFSRDQAPALVTWSRFDGGHYRHLVEHGYEYSPGKRSEIAFFPLYPLAARGVMAATGWDTTISLLAVAHLALFAAYWALSLYLNSGAPGSGPSPIRDRELNPSMPIADWVLAALVLWPTTFFFRMAYSESLFLLLAALTMLGMRRRWPLGTIALTAGLATAARPVGVALLAPVLFHVFETRATWRRRLLTACWAIPASCWGLLAFMAYQYFSFQDPLAFATTQAHWRIREPASGLEKAWALLTWEPIWMVYHPYSPGHWDSSGEGRALFSLQFANPIYFVATALLVAWGGLRHWLSAKEVAFSSLLLAIPYLTRAHEMCMNSHARFAAVVFPAYIVMGHLLAALPRVVSLALLGLMGAMLFLYSALFAAGYPFF